MSYSTKASNEIWVLGECRSSGDIAETTWELSGKAAELAASLNGCTGERHTVNIILLMDSAQCAEIKVASSYGAESAIVVKSDGLPFDRAASARVLAHLVTKHKPKIVLAAATAFGRSVMPYAAALLKTGLTADCTGLSIESESGLLLQTRPAIGGNIMATIKTPNHLPQMATVRPKTFKIPAPAGCGRIELREEAIPDELANPTVQTLSFEKFGSDERTLQDKEAVVSGGKGLRKAEGFSLISRLASLIGAGVGASRPTVDMKWIGYQHQVGLSGQTVSPKVYIAAGISGSVQHLAGMQRAEKIISINRDPEAQIFNVSDIAICGDLYEVVPMLIEKIEKFKRGAKS